MNSDLLKKIDRWGELHRCWLPIAMSIIFAVLWTFTMLPNTLIVRNLCLVFGGLLGAYILIKNLHLMFSVQAASLWLILSLFGWLILHLLLIGHDRLDQLAEFQSIWKRAALGSLFAIGLGIAVAQDQTLRSWKIILFGFLAPILIYGLKYGLTNYGVARGMAVPDFLQLYSTTAQFYVPKISYIFFCLPPLAVALGQLLDFRKVKLHQPHGVFAIYVMLILGAVLIFWSMQAKNGMAYASVLALIFVLISFKSASKKQFILVCLMIASLSFLVWSHIQKNQSWLSVVADFRVAAQADPASGDGAFVLGGPYPKNELGISARPENYVRFAWGFKARDLIRENPLGYGIVENSFGRLMKQKWPNTALAQCHSAWLDITLAIGIPGVLILILAAFLAIIQSRRLAPPWRAFVPWFLGSSMLLMLTTEVGQKDYLETFVLMVVFCAALSLQARLRDNKAVHVS